MNKPIFKILAIISGLMLVSVFSCEKDPHYEVLTGTVIGKVNLIGTQVQLTDNSGVEIVFEGSRPEKKAYSDEEGRYEMDDLPCGTYNLIFNKEGYCQHKIIGFQFVGGSKPVFSNFTSLYQLVDIHIDTLQLEIVNDFFAKGIRAILQLSKPPENSFFRCFLAKTSDVSYKNYMSTSKGPVHFVDGSYDFGTYPIDTVKFPAGSKVFMIIYPTSYNDQGYIDINTGLYIYSCVNIDNGSPVAGIVIPDLNELKSK